MSELFYVKAFWGFLGLVAALVAVIYRLFHSSLLKDLALTKTMIEKELRSSVISRINEQEERITKLECLLDSKLKSQTELIQKVIHLLNSK